MQTVAAPKFSLSNLSIQAQILLMLVFPLLILVVVTTNGVLEKRAVMVEMEYAEQIVKLNTLLDGVAHNFAVERGLTAGFLGSRGAVFGDKLQQQRKTADELANQFHTFVRSNVLTELLQHEEVRDTIEQLEDSFSGTAAIREKVDRLEAASGAFSHYSTLNSRALHLIQRVNLRVSNVVLSRNLNAYAALLWVKERAGQERGALNGVFSSGDVSLEQQSAITSYITDQALYLEQFQMYATSAEVDALKQKISPDALPDFYTMRAIFESRGPKYGVLQRLNRTIGYGGFIHNFKNYVLRGQKKHQKKFDQIYANTTQILDEYRALDGVSAAELKALDTIGDTFRTYFDYVPTITQMKLFDVPIGDVDEAVAVSDGPAVKAIQHLSQISGADSKQWLEVSTQRIKQIKQVSVTLAEQLKENAQLTATEAEHDLRNHLLFVSAAILLAILLAVKISRQIISGIYAVSAALTEVQRHSDFTIRASNQSSNEIGQISVAFNEHMDSLQNTISRVNSVVGGIAHGDFSQRVEPQLQGDLDTLKQGVNSSADKVEATMDTLGQVMDALGRGDFSVRIDDKIEEKFRNRVNHAMGSMDSLFKQVDEIIECLAAGDFGQRMTLQASGNIATLKENINRSMEAFEGSISTTVQAASRIGEGDLSQQIEGQFSGRLGELKESINTTQRALSGVVQQVRMASNSVSNGAGEIYSGNDRLSIRTSEQAASLEQTAASMEEMSATVETTANNAVLANSLAAEALSHAEAGSEVASNAVQSMEAINESSERITEITTLIDGIAFQTNLLALNAAVEAARAGEHGRGFAVVAGEVRTLAQRSADAAKEIKLLIDNSAEKIEQGTHWVSESGRALESIQGSISKVHDVASEIAAATTEQQTGINQVNQTVSQLDSATQENAALVEEAAAASNALNDQSQSLNQAVGFFKL